MHRRHFLKHSFHAGLSAVTLLTACKFSWPNKATNHLRDYADPVLGRAAAIKQQDAGHRSFSARQHQAMEQLQSADHQLRDVYRQMAADDFAAGKTMQLEGWIVSETEAFVHLLAVSEGAKP